MVHTDKVRRLGILWLSLGGNTSLDCIDIAIPFGCGNILKASTCRKTQQLSCFHTICIDSAPARLMRLLLVHAQALRLSNACPHAIFFIRFFFFCSFFLMLRSIFSALCSPATCHRDGSAESLLCVCAGCRLCCLIHAHYGLVCKAPALWTSYK